jgi:hypothetical protein
MAPDASIPRSLWIDSRRATVQPRDAPGAMLTMEDGEFACSKWENEFRQIAFFGNACENRGEAAVGKKEIALSRETNESIASDYSVSQLLRCLRDFPVIGSDSSTEPSYRH